MPIALPHFEEAVCRNDSGKSKYRRLTMTTQSITLEQTKQLMRLIEDAAYKVLAEAGINKDELQKLIENGDEFQSRIMTAVREFTVCGQFADEEVSSSYAYPNDYKPKDIAEQVAILKSLFSELKNVTFDEDMATRPLPLNAEGWFAIPRRELVAKTHEEAVEKVLELIKQQRKGKFHNHCKGKLGTQYLRHHECAVKKLEALADQQKDYDILAVPAQFGLHHRGRSVRRAREVFTADEFGLGIFEIGCMLLTHPERLQQNPDSLWIDCAGNEYAGYYGDFSRVLYFHISVGVTELGPFWPHDSNSRFGSASGFLPPQ